MATAKEEGNTTSNAQVLYVIGFQAPLVARFSTRSAKKLLVEITLKIAQFIYLPNL